MTRGIAAPYVALALAAAGCGASAGVSPRGKVTVATLPKVRPDAQARFDEGMRLLEAGPKRYEKARVEFVAATELDDKLYEAWHNIGFVDARLGRWETAKDAFERALALQPGSRKSVLGLGEALRALGRARDAQAIYAARLKADPDDVDLRYEYIRALRDGGQAPQALVEVRKILQQDSRNARAFNALGLVYLHVGKHALAEQALRRAAELDPKSAAVWNNLGLVALDDGRDVQAFQHFQKASEIDAGYGEAYLNKAAVYLDCGDYAKAAAELERARKIDPGDPRVHVALGVAARGQKRFDEAAAAYEQALALRPDYPPALYNLGLLYMDFKEDRKKARENLLLYRKVAPPNDPRLAEATSRLKELK